MNTFSCNVGLFQPKTFQVPVTDLYIFIKTYSEIGPMMHVLHTGCSLNPAASPVDLAGWFHVVPAPMPDLPVPGQAVLSLPRSQGQFTAGGVEVRFGSKQSAPLT